MQAHLPPIRKIADLISKMRRPRIAVRDLAGREDHKHYNKDLRGCPLEGWAWELIEIRIRVCLQAYRHRRVTLAPSGAAKPAGRNLNSSRLLTTTLAK
jgi:hypothetical protein